jgi:hypothetical protein
VLHPDADFRPFVAKAVAPEVRNAAFRKLFSDPHFNVMDGLDTYIDDYAKPSPLPEGVLQQMASAEFLKLFDDEAADEQSARLEGASSEAKSEDHGEPPGPPPASQEPASQEPHDHDTDLRLQPHDAPRRQDARGGAD